MAKPMFYIHDLKDDILIPFQTAHDVVRWWKNKFGGAKFDELNVTGKDTYPDCVVCGHTMVGPYLTPVLKKASTLRRYQVLDQDMRSIDIRNWDSAIWDDEPVSYIGGGLAASGKKRNFRRMAGPALYRKTARAAETQVDLDELVENGLPYPIHDKSAVRAMTAAEADYAYHVWDYNHTPHKSWKSKKKARSQWAKHKTWADAPIPFCESGEALMQRLKDEGLPAVV